MKKINYTYASGKRKTSSARVRLFHGKGENTVNGQPVEKYFSGAVAKAAWSKPFGITDISTKYYFSARIVGGGVKGQLDALVHGLARAVAKVNVDKFRKPVKKAGLLTRDSRKRQRRMVGTGGKSRRQKQSPKR